MFAPEQREEGERPLLPEEAVHCPGHLVATVREKLEGAVAFTRVDLDQGGLFESAPIRLREARNVQRTQSGETTEAFNGEIRYGLCREADPMGGRNQSVVAAPAGLPGPADHQHLDQDIDGDGTFADRCGREGQQVAKRAGRGVDGVGPHAVEVPHLPSQPVLVDGTETARRESLLG